MVNVELICSSASFWEVIEILTVLIVVAESQDVHLKTMLVVHHKFGLDGVQSSFFLSIASKIHLTMNPSLGTGQEVLLKVPSTKLFRTKILKGEMINWISGQALICQYGLSSARTSTYPCIGPRAKQRAILNARMAGNDIPQRESSVVASRIASRARWSLPFVRKSMAQAHKPSGI